MGFVYYSFGLVVMSLPPMVTVVRTDLGISRGAMGFALGAWALIYVGSAPPAGRVVDRLGLKWSIFFGSAFVAISGFARAGAQGLGTLWLAIAIFGIGGPLVSSAAPKLIAVWFGDQAERRLAVGLYTMAPALGSVTALLTTNAVFLPWLQQWRRVVAVQSGVAVVAALIWFGVSSLAPPEPVYEKKLPSSAQPGTTKLMWRLLLADVRIRVAVLMGLLVFFVNHGLSAWLPNALEDESGLSAKVASNWVAVSLIVGMVVTLILPRLATPQRRNLLLAVLATLVATSLVVIAVAPKSIDIVATLVLGVRAAMVPLVLVALMEAPAVNPQNMGSANGLWFSFAEMGGTLGPLAVGLVGDTSVGFAGSMILLASVLGLLLLLVGFDSRTADSKLPSTMT